MPFTDDNEPITEKDYARFRPAKDVLPAEVMAAFKKNKGGRPRAENPKVQVSIRLDKDLLETLQTNYPDWRTLLNNTMRAKVMGKARAGGGKKAGA